MLLGTVLGVVVIPGLYYLFARVSDGSIDSDVVREIFILNLPGMDYEKGMIGGN